MKYVGSAHQDLNLIDADSLFMRAQFGFRVYKTIKEKKLNQLEIGSMLDISQTDVSHLLNGHFSRFTTDKLLDFLKRIA